jgi:macrolide-specific efflux system membrane fusion protein
MKKIGILALCLALISVGVWFVTRGSLVRTADADSGSSAWRTASVERMDIGATVLATGVIRPQVGAEVEVGSRVSGVLQRLHVTVGDQVRRGALLAELDPTEFEARYQGAEAMLETAGVERAYAAQQYERAQDLIREQVIAQTEFDEAERAFRATAAREREAEAALSSARIQLDYTKIRAPISGVVATVSTQVGETVAASFAAPTFVTIIDLDRLEVWAYVDETDIGRVHVGQKATFTVDTYTSTDFEGVVTAIRPRAEIQDNVVNYVTVIEIGDRQGLVLRPEMTTTVNIVLEGRENVLAIPNGAVRRDGSGAYALVTDAAGAIRSPIETGFRGRSHTELIDGLEEGAVVILGDVEEND